MKKWIYILIGVIIFVVIQNKTPEKELRVRVIANSDSVFDQEIKYEVVSELIDTLDGLAIKDDKIEKTIANNMKQIDSKISKVLMENGVINQGYKVEITKEKFPTKHLDNKVIPGGKYKTLVVRIGKAEGKNWWSLLYPEFFNCSYEDVNSGEVEFKSYFWDKLKK